jgi:hypothetical protein
MEIQKNPSSATQEGKEKPKKQSQGKTDALVTGWKF